jgi:hypothetical protein
MSFRLRTLSWLVGGFLLLQAADFVFTWLLLSGVRRGDVYESNPVAQAILDRGGWAGLAAFKLAITGVALAAGLAVAQRRPSAGLRLLVVLCLMMVGVNVYSGTLLAAPDQNARAEKQALARHVDLHQRMDLNREFVNLRDVLCDDLLDGRTDTEQATERLREHVHQFAPQLRLPAAGRLPDPTRNDELAAYLAFHLHHRARARGLDRTATVSRLVRNVDLPPSDESRPDPFTPQWLRSGQSIN